VFVRLAAPLKKGAVGLLLPLLRHKEAALLALAGEETEKEIGLGGGGGADGEVAAAGGSSTAEAPLHTTQHNTQQ
jgi:hypothetical protein